MDDLNNQQELKAGAELQNGRYRIVRKLGQGGFGITYEGVQTGLERTVAIKEFFMKDYCNRDEQTNCVSVGTKGSMELVETFRKKFLKEARFIAQLGDVPHVVRIHDIFEENGTAYYVMEYVNGGSLKQLVASKGALNEQQAVSYITQIGQALHSLHQHNILHLDVKPDNVLLNSRSEAVLIDFGVSKRYDQTGSQTSTTPIGLSKGYAPFEQYKDGGMELFTPATDIYSLGATLYYLLVGHTPPEADEIMENGLPERPVNVSPAIWHAIELAMQPMKKNRPQSVEVFLSLLGNASVTPPPVIDDDSKTIPAATATVVESIKATEPESQSTKLQQEPTIPKRQFSLSAFKMSKQTMIALFLFVGTIVYLLMYRHGIYHNFFDFDEYDDIEDWDEKSDMMNIAYYTFWRNCTIVLHLLPLIGFLLLYRQARNKSVRLFTLTAIICSVAGIIFNYIFYQSYINQFTSDTDVNGSLLKVIDIFGLMLNVAWVYGLSVLMGSNCLSTKSRSWIGILLISRTLWLSFGVANIVSGGLYNVFSETLIPLMGEDWWMTSNNGLSYQDFHTDSGLYAVFWQILTLLTAFALWHLARSEAYAKPYNAADPMRLSPFNKWMGAAITSVVLITAGLYLLYTSVLSRWFESFCH